MRFSHITRCLSLSLFLLLIAGAPSTQPAKLRDITVSDLANVEHRLPDLAAKATVLLFVGIECPVSNGYVPEINRLVKVYRERGIAFYAIYSGTDVTAEAAVRHRKAFELSPAGVADVDCSIANAVGATMTLETAVVLADGSIVYCGRLDDQYASLGKKRFAAITHDLQNLLDDVLAGKVIEPRVTRAVGCAIVKPEAKKP